MTDDDGLFGCRLRLFSLAEELGNVSEACRQMGGDRSTYYRWKPKLERYGLDGLRVFERRRPRMPKQIGPHLEHRILAFALGHPGFGPRRISAELRRSKWGGIRISVHRVWRVLRRFKEPPELHIDASEPGEKVQMDCFYVGCLAGSKAVVCNTPRSTSQAPTTGTPGRCCDRASAIRPLGRPPSSSTSPPSSRRRARGSAR